MAIITLLSDFGSRDHYVASVKGKIYSVNPAATIVDISHSVETGHIAQAAYLLRSSFCDFPKGTIHLVAVDDSGKVPPGFIALKIEGHVFIGPDNGLFGLISDSEEYEAYNINPHKAGSTFYAKDITGPAAAKLSKSGVIAELGPPLDSYKRMLDIQIRATKDQIIGNVIHVDNYGNLITNISRPVFEQLWHGRRYFISFGKESAQKINSGYYQVEPGDCFIVFNSQNYLEIGIKQGHAAHLLGMEYGSTVIIKFEG